MIFKKRFSIYSSIRLACILIAGAPYMVDASCTADVAACLSKPSFTRYSERSPMTIEEINGVYQFVTNYKKIIKADYAHKHKALGQNVKIAVIDGIFDAGSDTEGALTESCIASTPEKSSYEYYYRQLEAQIIDNNHSNHVASLIAGKNGVAPETKIRVIDMYNDPATRNATSYNAAIIQAIGQAIESKADFINISMGIAPDHDQNDKISKEMKLAFYAARDAGIGIIMSAGNASEFMGQTAYTKSLYNLADKMKHHMRLVVATEYKFKGKESLASFSNRAGLASKHVLAAPGKDILAYGANMKKVVKSGTSMSAPLVTAAAAVLKSNDPQLTAPKIFKLLSRTARRYNLKSIKDLYTFDYGKGVINLKTALKAVKARKKAKSKNL